MIIVNDVECRNLQQQVAKNASDIAELKDDKQDTLVSGTNIKTINGNTVLGSGDIIIGEGGTTVTGGNGIIVSNEGEISIDTSVVAELSDIPTKTSDLQNDSGFITSSAIHTYTAGTGIDITNDVVSVNNNVAMKSDIPTYTDGTGIDITNNVISIDNTVALKTEIPTYTGGTGININSSNVVSIDNTVALKTDIPTYTGGSGITVSGTTIAADNTLARVADIPSITGLVMYNYKITISGLDGGTSTARSAVYIVSLPYQWDYSSLTKYDIIRRIPVWSIVADTDVTSTRKIMGLFHWQTGTIAQVDWVDRTFTYFDFVGGFNATIEPAAPAHW